jgi:uncharacterized protein (DUF1697 family)
MTESMNHLRHEHAAVALLRGINVGGNNLLPMNALTEIFAAAGCHAIQTYIQSGNIVFRSPAIDAVAPAVRAAIAARFGFNVPVIIRSAAEIARCIAACPFTKIATDPASLHVMFLEDPPAPTLIAALDPERSPPDRFAVIGRDLYLHLPNGAARTKLTNAYFDARLKTVSTQRNWRTVLTLAEMLEDM